YKSDFSTHGANTGNSGTWVNITPNAAGTISTPNNFWHRIELAVAPSDPHVVYALFQGYGSSNVTSIQKYDAVSNSWTVRTVPTIFDQGSNSNFTRGQAWYDLIAAVHPDNPNTVYRSEERRVGKECRSRWASCQRQKKHDGQLEVSDREEVPEKSAGRRS